MLLQLHKPGSKWSYINTSKHTLSRDAVRNIQSDIDFVLIAEELVHF